MVHDTSNFENKLNMLQELDRLMLKESGKRSPRQHVIASFLNQKAGLIDHLKNLAGSAPRWTVYGYFFDKGE